MLHKKSNGNNTGDNGSKTPEDNDGVAPNPIVDPIVVRAALELLLEARAP